MPYENSIKSQSCHRTDKDPLTIDLRFKGLTNVLLTSVNQRGPWRTWRHIDGDGQGFSSIGFVATPWVSRPPALPSYWWTFWTSVDASKNVTRRTNSFWTTLDFILHQAQFSFIRRHWMQIVPDFHMLTLNVLSTLVSLGRLIGCQTVFEVRRETQFGMEMYWFSSSFC